MRRQNTKNRKQKRNGRRAPSSSLRRLTLEQRLSDGNSYQGIQRTFLRLPGTPVLYTTTVTTGVISAQYLIEAGQIGDFNTRFGNTFDEYRILGVDFKLHPVSPNASGITVFALDEQTPGVLTLQQSQERVGGRVPNGSVSARPLDLKFRVTNITELGYTVISGAVNVGQLGIYTDATNYGSPVTVTPLWLLETMFHVEFRGIIGG